MDVTQSLPLSAAGAGDVLVYIDPRENERGLTGTTDLHYAPTTPWASGWRPGETAMGHLGSHITQSTEEIYAEGDPCT
jgi:hypothetical protein